MTFEHYKYIIQSAPFGYAYHEIILDDTGKPIDYRFLEVNPSFEKLTGLKSENVLNHKVTEVIPGIESEEFNWILYYGNIAVNGGEHSFEQYSDALNKWYKVQVYSPQKNYFTTIFTDITRDKEINAELEGFFSVNLDLLCIADMEGNFLKTNKAWSEILGYTTDELNQKKFIEFVHPDDLDSTLDAMKKLSDQKAVINFINRYRCKDGSYRYIEWRSHPYGSLIYAAARDITERIGIEKKLRESEQYTASLISAIPDLLFVLDENGIFVDYKVGSEDDLALPREVFIGKRIADVMPEHIASQTMECIKAVLRKETPSPIEYQLPINSKNDYFESNFYNFGQNLVIAIVRNVTARKKSEQSIRDSEANFRTFFETIDDLIFIANKSGEIFFSNSAVSRKLGYTQNELFGMHVLDVHPTDKRSEAENIFSDMFAGKRDYCPLPLMKKDGTILPVETRVWFGKWDGKDSIFGVSKDLTKEQESLQKFNKIFESNPALMAMSELKDGRFVEVNYAFTNKLGYSKDEIIGKTSLDLDLFSEPEQQQNLADDLRKNGKIYNCELKVKTKTGNILNGLFSGEIIDSQGKKYFLTVMVDITAQKEAEEKAKEASRAKSDFLANMSHEIRTPLNGVIGFTDLLRKTPLSPVQQQYVDNANTAGHALLSIINDILDFSKIEAGKLELDIVKTDIIELLGESVDIVKYQSSQKKLELLLNTAPDIPRFAIIDPVRLRQILVNLLSNAVKFTETGEVELKVAFEKIDNQNAYYSFFVRDTGIGINNDQQLKLFKAFSQGDSSTTRKFGGTGLGLIISNLLTEKMGGKIELISEVGKGSTFYFTLKFVYEEGGKEEKVSLGNIKRALVIDDNDNNRMILEHLLNYWGISYTGCDNGLTALKIIDNSEPFDIIIVDYIMPYLNGLDTIKMIRAKMNKPVEMQPVILLHSSADDAVIYEECRKLGVRNNIIKPVKSDDLFRVLKNIHNPIKNTVVIAEQPMQDYSSSTESVIPEILVAEDVSMNMLVVKSMLEQILGSVKIIEAINGEEALDAVKKSQPDLILMDIQMPKMDGLDATKEIREFEKSTGTHTPIVALTAGAVKGEEDKCLMAGMDHYLSKPIDQQLLKAVLEKYLVIEKNISKQLNDNEINESNTQHFNETQLMRRIGNNSKLFDELMKIAIEQIPEYIGMLEKAVILKNEKEVERLAHSIKGESLNLSFNALAKIAKKAENNPGNKEKLDAVIKNLWNEWRTISKIMNAKSLLSHRIERK